MALRARWTQLLLAFFLVGAAVAVCWPAAHGVFQWDDDQHVTSNENLLDSAGLARSWTTPTANNQYYPLTFTFFWLECHLFGQADPFGYHIVNMLVHGLNAVLLWRVLRRLKVPWAFPAAVLYVVHPMTVEAVAWISEFKTLLSCLFYLVSVWLWIAWRDQSPRTPRHWALYAAMTAAFFAAMCCKPVVCTFPAAMLVLDFWLRREDPDRGLASLWPSRRVLLGVLPLFVLAGLMAAVFAWTEKYHNGALGKEFQFSLLQRLLIAGRAAWFYPAKFAWPHPLLTIYHRWNVDPALWWQYLYPAAALLALAALWALRRRIGRGPLVAILIYLVTMAPALGFVNYYTMLFSFVADHFAYVGLLPLCALAVNILRAGLRQLAALPSPDSPFPQAAIAGLLLVALAPITSGEAARWKTVTTLWEPTVARNPDSWAARGMLAKGYINDGRFEDAKREAQASIALREPFALSHYALGTALQQEGDLPAAIREFQRYTQLDMERSGGWYALGAALEQVGDLAAAEKAYWNAGNLIPPVPEAFNKLAAILLRQQKWSDAAQAAGRAVQLLPDFAPARTNLGLALMKLGNLPAAAEQLHASLALQPANIPVRLTLARVEGMRGNRAAAEEQYQRILQETHGDPAVERELAEFRSTGPAATRPPFDAPAPRAP